MDGEIAMLGSDCLVHVFAFLNADDLLSVSGVCKDWLDAAQTPWLWRKLCLQRWGFCNVAAVDIERARDVWKKYYLRRSQLEGKMAQGRSGCDYACKSLRGHTGRVVGLAYLERNTATANEPWSFRSTVCSASTDGTVRVWDVKGGAELWRSPVQHSPLTGIVCDRENGLVITSDSSGLIKGWQAQTGAEVASYRVAASPRCTLLPYASKDRGFLFVGTAQGSLHTLATGPDWSETSSLAVCDGFGVAVLLASPDKKWVFAGTTEDRHGSSSSKVISAAGLTDPSAEGDPLSQCLPVQGFHAAVFIPTQPARLAVVHQAADRTGAVTVLDVNMKTSRYGKSEVQITQQGKSVSLPGNRSPHDVLLLEAKDGDALVMADHQDVWVCYLELGVNVEFLSANVTSLSVDSFRLVAACRDLSLRVYTWKDEQGEDGLTPVSRYYLLGGSHTMSRGFSHMACDYSSIVAVAEGNDGKDVLKAYSFAS